MWKAIIFIMLMTLTVSAQTTEETLSRALQKALNEVEQSRVVIESQNKLQDALEAKNTAQEAHIKTLNLLLELKDKEISRVLAIKCNETKWFWGIRKTKVCY